MIYTREDIRDTDGKWVNSGVFRTEAVKFKANRYYNSDPPKSSSWYEYWDEQLRRCKEGYEIGGHKITNHHYAYLNFSQIKLVPVDKNGKELKNAKKVYTQPDFWDGDYDYFWSIEIAANGMFTDHTQVPSTIQERIDWNRYNVTVKARLEYLKENKLNPESDSIYINTKRWRDEIAIAVLDRLQLNVKPHLDYLEGGYHMIVGKCRRKGYSYKNAAICANTYNTIRKSQTIIGAFDKKYLYPQGAMTMATSYINFYNEHTAWAKAREYVDKQEHRKASFEKYINGIKTEAGYQSEIIAITFKDNPDAARGKDPTYVLFEEAGKFPNLRASFVATRPGLTAGSFVTGQMLVFGTGGDMESGTVDFAHLFYNPIEFGCMPFMNIWDEEASTTTCGFFHPVYMNMEGYYDEQGNSFIEDAIKHEKKVRELLVKNATSSLALQERVQEWPLCPSESFLTVSTNDFPVVELKARLDKILRDNLHLKLGQPVYLTEDGFKEVKVIVADRVGNLVETIVKKKKVIAKPDLDNILDPIWRRQPTNKDLSGAVVIYESPISDAPVGLYKIGFDPYRQDKGESLASIYVYKCSHKLSYTKETIVAQYIGRPQSADTVNRIAEKLAEYYGTEIMFENEVTHVRDYFIRRNKINLMALQPDTVITNAIGKSKTQRVYGCHMNEKLKDAGEKYIKNWLLEERDVDDNDKMLINIDLINDPGLLEELISYNRKGNFDRVMSLMMVLFQRAEEEEGKYYGEQQVNPSGKELLEQMKRQYRKN